MTSSIKKIVYEGKAKILYCSSDPKILIQHFKDDATANNAEKHAIIKSKGILNNFISEYLMSKIEDNGIETHFIKRINQREQLIKKVEIIPIELVVRNKASGSIVKRYNLKESLEFTDPLIEFFLKNDNLGDPLLNESHIIEFKWANYEEIQLMKSLALKINNILQNIFRNIGIELIDFKLEFGRVDYDKNKDKIILADEISPDNCRLWDKKTRKKLDKDIFRKNLGNLIDGYQEVLTRLGLQIN